MSTALVRLEDTPQSWEIVLRGIGRYSWQSAWGATALLAVAGAHRRVMYRWLWGEVFAEVPRGIMGESFIEPALRFTARRNRMGRLS